MSAVYQKNYALIDWSKDLGPVERRDRTSRGVGNVISDNLPDQLEHHGFADGRRTDSKSQFRRWTKEAGLIERGNDRESQKPVHDPDLRPDVALAVEMVKNGYRPNIPRE